MRAYDDCPECGKKKTKYKALCWDCWSIKRTQTKRDIDNGRELNCKKCGAILTESNWLPSNKKQYSLICKDCNNSRARNYLSETKDRRRLQRLKLKFEVISHYGGKCACCGETEIDFLNLDHILNDGADHRRKVGYDMYVWSKRNKYPDIFQVLCMNCNFAKGKDGICPHEIERQKLAQQSEQS